MNDTTYWVMQGPSGRILIETISLSEKDTKAKFGSKDTGWKAVKVNITLAGNKWCPQL